MQNIPVYVSRFQPRRPLIDPQTGDRLRYRTYPKGAKEVRTALTRLYRTSEMSNRICQIQLYRWVQSPEFVEQPTIDSLYKYLIRNYDLPASKGHFGRTILNALGYDAKVLKGKTKENPKPVYTYLFHNRLELQYGLEYMICSWLRKFLQLHGAPEDVPSGLDAMMGELEMLANSDDMEAIEIYIEPIMDEIRDETKEPDWPKLLVGHKPSEEDKELYGAIKEEPVTAPHGKIKSF